MSRSPWTRPKVLSLRDRARTVDQILAKRFDTLLPQVMRETGFDMWLIICHEDNHDPIFNTLIPWECWAPILQMVVFYDPGPDQPIERFNISRTNMQGLMIDAWNPDGPDDQWTGLKQVIKSCNPARIGINQSDVIWAADGLTVALKDRLVQTLGPNLTSRLEPAESLCIRWLETRILEELDLYQSANTIAHHLIQACFSRQTVTPHVTTLKDLRWTYWQAAADLGLQVSFPPFFRIIRSEADQAHWGKDDRTVRPGDLLHCDVGVIYLRLNTDHQELAYVLRPGETDAPEGLKQGMAQANRLQDIFTKSWKIGLTGNEILARALHTAREAEINTPRIYSHSLGHFLHEPGPLIGLPWEQDSIPGRGDVVVNLNTCYTVELSADLPVSEWNNQTVRFMLEQDACLTEAGVTYIHGRQTEFHLI